MFFVPPCAMHLYQDMPLHKDEIASSGDFVPPKARIDFEELCVREYDGNRVLALRIRHKNNSYYVLVQAILENSVGGGA